MKRLCAAFIVSAALTASAAGAAFASPSPNGPGQPNLDCADVASSPPGFQTAGFANAESHYAGSDGTPSLLHSQSGNAVAQYDVACFQVSSHR